MAEPATITERALFGFRVGGVQEFIDSARTTEDFWASSYLISHLTRSAADVIIREFGGNALIFPSFDSRNADDAEADLRIAAFPNGVLAEVPLVRVQGSLLQNSLGQDVEERFHQAWQSTMAAVREILERIGALSTDAARAIWQRQAGRRAFETFWAWTPISANESYLDAYRRLSGLLEARKLLRNFDCTGGGEPHTKCTQCGKLQALQDFDVYSESRSKAYWKELADAEDHRIEYRFRSSEQLCAVCVTCRMASRSRAFGKQDLRRAQPSTSAIAVSPFLKTIFGVWEDIGSAPETPGLATRRAEFQKRLSQFIVNVKAVMGAVGVSPLKDSPYRGLSLEDYGYDELRQLTRFDGDWFFAGTYDDARLTKELERERTVSSDLLKAARESLKALVEFVGREPSRYLALVKIDGDRVGDWISGVMTGKDPTLDSHRELSKALGRIGAAARPVIEQQLMGRLIYSGGDDLLFLAPVAGLTGGIAEILERVRKAMAPDYDLFQCSAAALVMPHSDSLSGSIREVDHLLRSEAKKKYERDCVVVSARRQSGQRTDAVLRSKDCAAFQTLVTAMSKPEEPGGVSPRIASQLSMMVAGLNGHGSDVSAMEDLSLFLLGRHMKQDGAAASGSSQEALKTAIMALTNAAAKLGQKKKGGPGQYLEHALLTARFLERSEAQR